MSIEDETTNTAAAEAGEAMAAQQEPWVGPVHYRFGRSIGPWGTASRAVAAAALFGWALAVPHDHPIGTVPGTGVLWWNALLGLVLIPTAMTLAVRLRGRDAVPLRAGIGAELLAVVAFLAVTQVIPVAMLLALGATFVVQVVRGDGGCELLAIPNWLLRRNDRLFCLVFTPIDILEARAWRRHSEADDEPARTVNRRRTPG